MDRKSLKKAYIWVIIAAATAAVGFSVFHFPTEHLDLRLLVLAAVTLSISSRLTIRIPRLSGHNSVSDTFFFLTILLFCGGKGPLFAPAGALRSSIKVC